MREDIRLKMMQDAKLREFMRYHPEWYRTLSRNPQRLNEMEKESNYFYGKTFPQRVERMQNNVSMMVMLMEMIKMGQSTVSETVQSVTN
ncbi:YlbE-like family protein [Shouchella sp. 1P09AA]|uniref:YlbE-like family protein n=1 Tax=Bacillaceae TaxID=186817 RepID=UPI000C08325E|nr:MULTISPECIES: YlbE-like family protein [Bacillaceae]UTR04876.1 YlbE-like family protein [Alkalihalobacillus sp. LMS6]